MFTAILLIGMFSLTCKNSHASRSVEMLEESQQSFWHIMNCCIGGLRVYHMYWCIQLTLPQEGDITCSLARSPANICAPNGCQEKRVRPSHLRGYSNSRSSFFLVPRNPSFLACTDYVFCQRPSGRLFIFVFYFVFILFLFYFFMVTYLLNNELFLLHKY